MVAGSTDSSPQTANDLAADPLDFKPGGVWSRVGELVLLVITYLCLIRFPDLQPLQLDPSWRMTLSYLVGSGAQYGTDIVFTYGPLGYLLAQAGTGFNWTHHLVWELGANLVFAGTLVWLGRQVHGVQRALYYAFMWGFAIGYGDVFQMILVLIYAVALLRPTVSERPWAAAGCGFLLGVLALIKFTNLLFAGFALACAAGGLVLSRQHRLAFAGLAGFGVAFVGGWLAWGQNLVNVPAFVINSLSISNGYVGAMGIAPPASWLTAGLLAAAALVVYLLLPLVDRQFDAKKWAAIAIAGAGGFLNWKHGFVRADGHVIAHYFFCLFVLITHTALLPPARAAWGCMVQRLALAVGSIASSVGIGLFSISTLTHFGAGLNLRIALSTAQLADLPTVKAQADEAISQMGQGLRLPSLQAYGQDGRRVDVMGHENGWLIVNGVNYRPRPTLQSYAAMTPRLAQLNADFIANPVRAPELVLQRVQTIDERLPTLDDAPALRYLYHHYNYDLKEGGFLFWSRREFDPTREKKVLLSESRVAMGETVETPVQGEDMIWCEIEVADTLPGKARRFLYRPPRVWIDTDDGGEDQRRFHLPPVMAAGGFPVYPYFTNEDNIIHFQQGGPAPRLMRFSVVTDEGAAAFFKPEYTVRFWAFPPARRTDLPVGTLPEVIRFRPVGRVPNRIDSAYEPALDHREGVDYLLVHAPSEMQFDLTPDLAKIAGHYGIFAGAYTGEDQTDGVGFFIEGLREDGSREVLWERNLAPLTEPGDRGRLPFEIKIPEGIKTLILRTDSGGTGNLAYDWAYWSEVRFNP